MAKKKTEDTPKEEKYKEARAKEVTLLIKKRYKDMELNRWVQPKEKIKVSEKRAKEILSHKDKLAEILEIK